jgi:hypothetical protein
VWVYMYLYLFVGLCVESLQTVEEEKENEELGNPRYSGRRPPSSPLTKQ